MPRATAHTTPHPIKAVLALRRMPQAELARIIGCSPYWCGRVINGTVPAPAKFCSAAAEALGMPVEELFADDRDDVSRLIERTCSAHGLGVTVTDTAVLDEIAALIHRARPA